MSSKRKVYIACSDGFPYSSRAIYFDRAIWKPREDKSKYNVGETVSCKELSNALKALKNGYDLLKVGDEMWLKIKDNKC